MYSSYSSSSCVRLNFRGRRSQGGFSLNSLDYGVFWPSKYKVNIFWSKKGPEVFSWPSRSFKNSLFIWAFQWLCKPYIFFSYLTKIENKEFLIMITCKISVDLFDFKNSLLVYLYLSMALSTHRRAVWIFSNMIKRLLSFVALKTPPALLDFW